MIQFGTTPLAWSHDADPAIGAEVTLDACLAQAGKIGFAGIEFGRKFPTDPEVLKKKLESNGLVLISGIYRSSLLTRSLADEKQAMQPFLDFLTAMRCDMVLVYEASNAVFGDPKNPVKTRPRLAKDHWRSFGADVEALAAHCAAQGLALAYRHHVGTIVESGEDIENLMANTGPYTRLLFDTGHAMFGGADPMLLAQRHLGRIAHIHIKNVRMPIVAEVRNRDMSYLDAIRRGVFSVPGDPSGIIDFLPLLKIFAAQNYDGWLVVDSEQDPVTQDPKVYQSMGLKSLREIARAAGLQ